MRSRTHIQTITVCVASIALLVESIYGLSQVMGWSTSRNELFLLTGHFDNPGPFGGFIAVLLAIVASWVLMKSLELKEKVHYVLTDSKMLFFWTEIGLCGIASFFGSIVLISSLSRSAWAGFVIAAIMFILREWDSLSLWHRIIKKSFPLLCALFIIVSLTSFFVKKESAIGRALIWNIECRVIAHNLLKGVGEGRGLGAFGLEQAEFFRQNDRSSLMKKVAGCPEYAFNEYLGIGMEYGISAMLLVVISVLLCVWTLLRRRSPFAYGAIVYAVFAFGSYPLSIWQFRLLGLTFAIASVVSLISTFSLPYIIGSLMGVSMLCCVVGGTICNEAKRFETEQVWMGLRRFSEMGIYEEAVSGYEGIYMELKDNYRFLYDYGYALFKTERYQEAINILRDGADRSSDPMFHNIIGRCSEALGWYRIAEEEYALAHNMVPNRLYPLVLLKELYERQGNLMGADSVLNLIRQVPFDQNNRTMKNLLYRAEGYETDI